MSNSTAMARRIGVVALGAILAVGLAACGSDGSAQARKALGGDEAVAPSLAGQIEPFASLTMSASADDADALRAGGDAETSRVPRIHLTLSSPEATIQRFGETRKGYPGECTNPKNDASLGLPLSAAAVPAGETRESCVQSKGNETLSQELTYKLPETQYLLWVYTKVTPLLGAEDELQCAIIDPANWKAVKKSDYGCDLRWMQQGNHLNPVPRVRLTKKPTVVVTDRHQGKQLLEQHCSKNQPECSYTAARQEIVQVPESQWTVIDVYNNCGPDKHEPATHSYTQSKAFTLKDTFGVTATGGFNLKIVEIKIAAKYEHAWSNTNEITFGIRNPVPWGWADIIYAQPAYLEVDGDFTIKADDATYVVRDANFKLPLDPDWSDEMGNNKFPAVEKHSRGAKITCPASPYQGSTGTKMLDGSDAPTADTLRP